MDREGVWRDASPPPVVQCAPTGPWPSSKGGDPADRILAITLLQLSAEWGPDPFRGALLA